MRPTVVVPLGAALALAVLGAPASASHCGAFCYPRSCCTPAQCCMPCVRYQVCYRTVCEEQMSTCYRPVYRTVMKECRYTTCRPVYETHYRTHCYNVTKAV